MSANRTSGFGADFHFSGNRVYQDLTVKPSAVLLVYDFSSMGNMTDGTLIRSKFLVFFVFVGCGCHGSGSPSVNLTTAQKLSDSFMSNWVAHRTDAAFDEMEPEFTGTVTRAEFAVQLEKLSQYCGWPLDSELKHVENGTKVYLDGHTNSTRKFTYAATTTQYPKGQCYFSIEVAPSGKSAKVTTFGPLRVTSGNPFP